MNYIEKMLVPYKPTKILWNCVFEMKAGNFQLYDEVWFHRSGEASVVQKTYKMDLSRGRAR